MSGLESQEPRIPEGYEMPREQEIVPEKDTGPKWTPELIPNGDVGGFLDEQEKKDTDDEKHPTIH